MFPLGTDTRHPVWCNSSGLHCSSGVSKVSVGVVKSESGVSYPSLGVEKFPSGESYASPGVV